MVVPRQRCIIMCRIDSTTLPVVVWLTALATILSQGEGRSTFRSNALERSTFLGRTHQMDTKGESGALVVPASSPANRSQPLTLLKQVWRELLSSIRCSAEKHHWSLPISSGEVGCQGKPIGNIVEQSAPRIGSSGNAARYSWIPFFFLHSQPDRVDTRTGQIEVVALSGEQLRWFVALTCAILTITTYAAAYLSLLGQWNHKPEHDRPHSARCHTHRSSFDSSSSRSHHAPRVPSTKRASASMGPPSRSSSKESVERKTSRKSSARTHNESENEPAQHLQSALQNRLTEPTDSTSTCSDDSIWAEGEHECIQIPFDELVETVGVSAMCLHDPRQKSGISQLSYKAAVPLIAAQSTVLQLVLLITMFYQLKPREIHQGQHPLSGRIVFIAIYLHSLACVQELPFSVQIFRFFVDFHDNLGNVMWMGSVLITDAFVVPLLCFYLGALYLCTSQSAGDVILNAVAVAFVREIDNWIVRFDLITTILGGKKQYPKVHIPVSSGTMRALSLWTVFFPVLPGVVALIMCWLGFHVLGL